MSSIKVSALTAKTSPSGSEELLINDGGVSKKITLGNAFTDTNTTYSVQDGELSENNFTDADHTKLNGIEASADVTDATNVTAAGALMDSEVTNLADVKAFDTTDYATAGHNHSGTYATAAQGTTADAALPKAGGAMTGAITTNSTFDGRDVATDGTKLDGIATSANNYSHPTGAGNKHIPTGGSSGEFLKYDSSGTAVWASDNNDNTTYTAGGDYGMTLSSTEFRLEDDRRRNSSSTDIYSGNTHDYTFYDADVGIRWYTAGAEEMRLEDDGDLHVDGNVTAYSTTVSDRNLKTDIKNIDNALEKVNKLNGCTFTYTSDGKESAGLIAQDVEEVLPSAVTTSKLVFHGEEGKEYKVLQYDQTIGLLVEAVKELSAKVEKLENK